MDTRLNDSIANAKSYVAGRSRMLELDGIRALAVLFVISFHSWYFLRYTMPSTEAFRDFSDSIPFFLGFIRRGDVGVDVFFVLSGYLLSMQLFRETKFGNSINLKRFYAHRIFRIYPLYIIVLLIAAVDVGPSWKYLENLLAYNIWVNPNVIIAPWTWSLSVELEFYAIVPLLILFAKTSSRLSFMTVVACILSIGWSAAILARFPNLQNYSFIDLDISKMGADLRIFYKNLYVAFPVRIAQFVVGIAGAWLSLNYNSSIVSVCERNKRLVLTLIAAGFFVPMLHNPYTQLDPSNKYIVMFELTFGRVCFATSVAILIVLLHADVLPKLKAVLSSAPLLIVGKYSYSMFLFHPVFVAIGIYLIVGIKDVVAVSALQYIGVLVFSVVSSIMLGYITWHTVERPAIRLGKRLFG